MLLLIDSGIIRLRTLEQRCTSGSWRAELISCEVVFIKGHKVPEGKRSLAFAPYRFHQANFG
jgi:hypothetical protein